MEHQLKVDNAFQSSGISNSSIRKGGPTMCLFIRTKKETSALCKNTRSSGIAVSESTALLVGFGQYNESPRIGAEHFLVSLYGFTNGHGDRLFSTFDRCILS